MSLVRRLARPLLAASFIASGIDAVLHPRPRAEAIQPMINRLGPAVTLPTNPELAVRVNGALRAGAGVLFALGRLPRLSAALLAVSQLPSTASNLRFWREQDPLARREQCTQLLRQASLLGGAFLGAVDIERRSELTWRGRRAVRRATKAGKRAERAARHSARDARRTARDARHTPHGTKRTTCGWCAPRPRPRRPS